MGNALDWAAKTAQTADMGVTGCDWRFVCAFNLYFNKIGIFLPCRILVQLLHLSGIVLLERCLNWSDCEQQITVTRFPTLRCDMCRRCDE